MEVVGGLCGGGKRWPAAERMARRRPDRPSGLGFSTYGANITAEGSRLIIARTRFSNRLDGLRWRRVAASLSGLKTQAIGSPPGFPGQVACQGAADLSENFTL
jgi:hypothetical protein